MGEAGREETLKVTNFSVPSWTQAASIAARELSKEWGTRVATGSSWAGECLQAESLLAGPLETCHKCTSQDWNGCLRLGALGWVLWFWHLQPWA